MKLTADSRIKYAPPDAARIHSTETSFGVPSGSSGSGSFFLVLVF
jgi:hypothetical protein